MFSTCNRLHVYSLLFASSFQIVQVVFLSLLLPRAGEVVIHYLESPFPLPYTLLRLRSFDLWFYLGGGRVII